MPSCSTDIWSLWIRVLFFVSLTSFITTIAHEHYNHQNTSAKSRNWDPKYSQIYLVSPYSTRYVWNFSFQRRVRNFAHYAPKGRYITNRLILLAQWTCVLSMANTSLQRISRLIFKMETGCVLFQLGNKFSYIIYINAILRKYEFLLFFLLGIIALET